MTVSTIDGRREIYEMMLRMYDVTCMQYGVFLCHHVIPIEMQGVAFPLRPRILCLPELIQQKPSHITSLTLTMMWWPESNTWDRKQALKQAIKLCI